MIGRLGRALARRGRTARRATLISAAARPSGPTRPGNGARRAYNIYHHQLKMPSLRAYRNHVLGSLGFAVATSALYYASHQESVPISGRQRFMALSHGLEMRLGAFAYSSALQQNEGKVLPDDHPDTLLSRKVAAQILKVTDLDAAKAEVSVIDAPQELNAGCFPGGKIVVFTGLLRHIDGQPAGPHAAAAGVTGTGGTGGAAPQQSPAPDSPAARMAAAAREHDLGGAANSANARSTRLRLFGSAAPPPGPSAAEIAAAQERWRIENELAVVLGHEVAHALARHTAEQISFMMPLLLLNLVLNASPLLGLMYDFSIRLPHSRQHESEADQIGLNLMARAGYDPTFAPPLWRSMHACPTSMHYFSTHPADEVRAANLERWIPAAKRDAEEFRRKHAPNQPQQPQPQKRRRFAGFLF